MFLLSASIVLTGVVWGTDDSGTAALNGGDSRLRGNDMGSASNDMGSAIASLGDGVYLTEGETVPSDFIPIDALADTDWTVTLSQTPPNADSNAYLSGTQIKFVVNFSRTTPGDVDFDQEYELYVNSALTALPIFRGVDAINGKPIFITKPATTVVIDRGDGKGPITYFKYVYMFNPALTQAELNTMTNTNFSATVQLITVNGETEIPNPIHVGDSTTWGTGNIVIKPPVPPAVSGSVSISKSVDAIYKEKSGTPGAYEVSAGNKQWVQPGDIVKFNISMYDNLRNYEANAAYYGSSFPYPTYAHLVEYLPAGYTAVQPSGTNITGIGNDLNNGWTQWNSGTNTPTLAGGELAGATTCITNGGTVWVHDYNYDTQRTDSGGIMPFYAQVNAGVTSTTDAADLHNVVHSTSGPDPYNPGDKEKEAGVGVGVGDKPPEPPGPPTPLDVYDLALITEILDSNPNPHFNQVFDVVGARDMTFQVLVTNQGMMPVDNVTVALYLPENIQMLDGNSIWNPTVGEINADGWTYAGTKVPQSTPQNWTPVNMYTKTLTNGKIHYPTFGPAYWKEMDFLPGREQIYNVSASWGDVDLQFHARVTGDAEEADAAVTTLSESTWIYAAEILSFTQYTGPGYLVSPTHAEYESSGNAECPPFTTTWEADDLAAPMPVDVDSWPDSDPYNDLYDPRPTWNYAWGGMGISDRSSSGSGRVLPTGLEWAYSNVASNTNGGYAKELAGITDRNAKNPDYNKGGQQGPDEDDYDFAVVRVVKAKPDVDYGTQDLTKSRMSWTDVHASVVSNPNNEMTGNIISRVTDSTHGGSGTKDYANRLVGRSKSIQDTYGKDKPDPNMPDHPYISDDGVITDYNSVFVYKLTINAGSHDMANMVLEDTLPEGLRYLKIADVNAYHNFQESSQFAYTDEPAFYSQYYWKADTLPDGTKAIVPGSSLHRREWSQYYEYYGEISAGNTYAAWPAQDPFKNAYSASYAELISNTGIMVGESASDLTTYINGFKIDSYGNNTVRFSATNLHETVINLYFLVGLDPEYALIPGHTYQNKAELSYDGEPRKEITEDKYVTVGYDGASAFVTKFVNTASGNTNDYKGEGSYNLITGSSASVKYRIQLRTQGSGGFEPGTININDKIKEYADAAGATISDVTGISIRAFNQNTFIPNIAANDGSRVSGEEGYIAAAYNNGVLNIHNNAHAIEPNRLYYIEFTVNYAGIKPGANIRNTTGTTTNSLRPIDFELYKTDASTPPLSLSGSGFELYYTDSNGNINTSDPVKGALGAAVYNPDTAVSVVLGPTDYSFNFIPKNYFPQSRWRIAFLEVTAPTGGNPAYLPGRVYYMDLVKDASGNLSWQIPAGLNGSDLREDTTSSTDNKYQFINRNTEETKAKMKITKAWANGIDATAQGLVSDFYYIDPTMTPAGTERPFSHYVTGDPSGWYYYTPDLTTGYYQIVEYSSVGYGPRDTDAWTFTGVVTRSGPSGTVDYYRYVLKELVLLGEDTDADGFGTLTIDGKSAPELNDTLAVTNAQVGDFNLNKTWAVWPGSTDATPTAKPPASATKFVLYNGLERYELTSNGVYNAATGYSFSRSYIPAGTYILYEYVNNSYEEYGPSEDVGGWLREADHDADYAGYLAYRYKVEDPIVIPVVSANRPNPDVAVENDDTPVKDTPASIRLIKTDGGGDPLAGAVFKLSKTLNNGDNWETYGVPNIADEPNTGDVAGTIFTFTLPNGVNRVGEYTLTETTTPSGYNGLTQSLRLGIDKDGKIISIDGVPADIGASVITGSDTASVTGEKVTLELDQAGAKPISVITVKNTVIPGPQIKLLKYGTNGSNEILLAGGEFKLSGTGSRSGWFSTQIINSTTGITFTLPTIADSGWTDYAGDYTLTEISPPNGYIGMAGTATVTLNAAGVITNIAYTDAGGNTSVVTETGSNGVSIKVVDKIIDGKQIKLIKTSSGASPFNLDGAQFRLTGNGPVGGPPSALYDSGVLTILNAGDGIWFTLPAGDPAGTYTLHEVTPPVGYTGIGDVELVINSNGEITAILGSDSAKVIFGTDSSTPGDHITVRNTINPGKNIKLYKVDKDNTNKRLLGKFTLTKVGGSWSTQEEITIEANGLQFTLPAGNPAGTYTLTEDVAPAGYKKIDPITITIDENGKIKTVSNNTVATITDNELSITIKDELIPGTQITIKKTDANTDPGKRINLQGAKFRLQSNVLVGTPAAMYDSGWSDATDANGNVTLTLPEGDKAGTYTLTEQPRSGYTGLGPVTLEFDSEGKMVPPALGAPEDVALIDIDSGGFGLRVQNKVIEGPQITLTKTNNDGSNLIYLAGAVFRLVGVTAADGQPLTYDSGEVTTGSDGKLVFKLKDGDFVGTYTLTEVAAPNGYTGLTSPVTITIAADANGLGYISASSNPGLVSIDGNKLGITAKNSIISGKSITLNKVMSNASETPLTGAVFELYGITPKSGNTTWSAGWTSGPLPVGGSGALTFGLPAGDPAGDYRLTEIMPPNGYTGLTSPVTIRIDSNGKIIGISNSAGVIVIPGTSTAGGDVDDNTMIRILGTGLGLVVKNDLKPGQQITLKKTDLKGALLTGAEFTLTSTFEFGSPPARYQSVQTVASDGTLTFNLPEGDPEDDYTLTESKVPNGYTGIAPVTLHIDANGKITEVDGVAIGGSGFNPNVTVSNSGNYITVKNTIKDGRKISLIKTAADGTTALSGAQFTLIGKTPAPADNTLTPPYPGATWTSYSDGPYTAANGITFTLPSGDPAGLYTLHEDAAPNGYVQMNDVTLEIDSLGRVVAVTGADKDLIDIQNDQISIKVLNHIKAGSQISLLKQNATGTTNLAGATFMLTGVTPASGATWTTYGPVTQAITNANNGLIFNLPEGDPAGTYTLEELTAPNGYTVGLSTPVTLTIDSDGKILSVASATNIVLDSNKLGLRVRNTIKDGLPIELIKTDATGNTKLADAVFELSWTSLTNALPTGGSDQQTTLVNGTLTFTLPKGNPEGVYTLREGTAPNGYQLMSDVYLHIDSSGKITKITVGPDFVDDASTVVTLNGVSGASITAKDTIRPGLEIDLTKYGADPGTGTRPVLAGAQFQLSIPATGYKSAVFTTGNDGKLKFKLPDGNPAGTYVLTEVQAPAGYRPMAPVTLVIDSAGNVIVQNYSDGSTPPVSVAAGGTLGELVNLNANNDDKIYDAALRKWVSAVNGKVTPGVQDSIDTANGGVPSPVVKVRRGDIVEYTIRVFNQCEWPMQVREIVDDLPAGLAFDKSLNPDWTNPILPLFVNKLYYNGPPIELTPKGTADSSRDVKLYLRVDSSIKFGEAVTNFAEITEETDENGNPVKDVDSTPDDDLEDDGTENDKTLKDNVIDEHRGGIDGDDEYGDYGKDKDEDDHDIAKIIVEKEYDAALRKWVSDVEHDGQWLPSVIAEPQNGVATPPVPVYRGGLVKYTIKVFNQCEWPLKTPIITDSLPGWLEWDPQIQAEYNPGWVYNEGTGLITYTYADGGPVLKPNTRPNGTYDKDSTAEITITLRVKTDVPSNEIITNTAEISKLTDENDKEVKDIDSVPDSNLINDGTEEKGNLKDNEIDEHRGGIDGDEEYGGYGPGKDEDDHDIAKVIVGDLIISVEVDKDTIKRTSAAYISDHDPANFTNVGLADEMYRYNIDFRSTSSVSATEFVVDDPLEAVSAPGAYEDQVRVDGLWTPAVWGDMDGKMNVWYKTNTGAGAEDGNLAAANLVTTANPRLYPNTGWKLWKHIDASGTAEFANGVIPRERLALPAGVSSAPDAAVYITAIRFEYGPVKVGFTSRNENKEASLNKDYRDSNGIEESDSRNRISALPTQPDLSSSPVKAQSVQVVSPQANSISALSLRIATQGAAVPLVSEITALAVPEKGVSDWTPPGEPGAPNYSEALADLTAENAITLRPATYLVRTTRPMATEDIVSSVSAHIARGTVYDEDRDRVLTREIVTGTLEPGPIDPGSIVQQDSFVNNAAGSGIVFRGGHWVDRNGNRLRVGRGGPAGTADVMALGVWFAAMIAALVCLILLRLTYAGGRRRKWASGPDRVAGDSRLRGNDSVLRGNDRNNGGAAR
ncbi:hypothetical protein AGMMS49983_02030 [Clostridia bacterium]|nr:hypothetical protein AGMMS49983_02030 [Clostridia bacterium]